MRMTDAPLKQFYRKISELENNLQVVKVEDFLKSQDNQYYQLEDGIIKDIDIHNTNYNNTDKIISIDNMSGQSYPITLHTKNGIIDGTISDMVSQQYQINRDKKEYSRLIYDKTISYMNMDLIDSTLDYTSIYVDCPSISNEIEYSVLQILNIISRIDHPVDLYIRYSDKYSLNKKEISFCIFLINQIYNNKLIDKIKTINIPLYLLKLLVLSSKFYKQVKYILGIENLLLEIISEKDISMDKLDRYKLNKYEIKANNIYLYNKVKLTPEFEIDIIKYLNSFYRIGNLYLPYIDKSFGEDITNEIYQLESKCNRIYYYGFNLNSDLDIILLNKDVECYFHKDYVLEILDGPDNRLNIMFNEGKEYKLIYIDNTMDDNKYISTKVINNIEFIFIKDITDLNLII